MKRIDSLEKKIRQITEIEVIVKGINEDTQKNSHKLDNMLNYNINSLENNFETINKQVGVNVKKLTALENDRLTSLENRIEAI